MCFICSAYCKWRHAFAIAIQTRVAHELNDLTFPRSQPDTQWPLVGQHHRKHKADEWVPIACVQSFCVVSHNWLLLFFFWWEGFLLVLWASEPMSLPHGPLFGGLKGKPKWMRCEYCRHRVIDVLSGWFG